jgi:hydrogenase maturation protein HypF
VTDRVVGIAYDGTGYGPDRAVWGAEGLVADLTSYDRVFHLRYAPLPGGNLAARNPWRSALGYLSLEPAAEPAFAEAFQGIPESELRVARQQIGSRFNAPLASSMGRLFDAAAAVLGVRQHNRYEGQAAMELESLAGSGGGRALPFPVAESPGEGLILDPLPLLEALGNGRARGVDLRELAAGFHDAVARATVEVVDRVAQERGIRKVALGGGVFQNARLLDATVSGLVGRGLEVLVPRALSPNDGAISYGQAAIAAAVLQSNAV